MLALLWPRGQRLYGEAVCQAPPKAGVSLFLKCNEHMMMSSGVM